MENQKKVYEWVLTMSKGDDVILTENQYEFYAKKMEEDDNRKLMFSDFGFNPVFVVSEIKVPANYIRRKYPCRDCHSAGRNADNTDWCTTCEGSGINIPE